MTCPPHCARRGQSHAGSLLCSAPSQGMGWMHAVHWFPRTPLSCVAFPLYQAAGLGQKILSLESHELKRSREEAISITHKLPRLQTTCRPQRVLLSFGVTGHPCQVQHLQHRALKNITWTGQEVDWELRPPFNLVTQTLALSWTWGLLGAWPFQSGLDSLRELPHSPLEIVFVGMKHVCSVILSTNLGSEPLWKSSGEQILNRWTGSRSFSCWRCSCWLNFYICNETREHKDVAY